MSDFEMELSKCFQNVLPRCTGGRALTLVREVHAPRGRHGVS